MSTAKIRGQCLRATAHMKSVIKNPRAYLFTMLARREQQEGRWESQSNLLAEWDERTRILAAMIPAQSSVIEFGAARLVLDKYLAPGCHYQPSDIVLRSPDTLVLDLNQRPLMALNRKFDWAVFSGVLEYVCDIPSLVEWLANYAKEIAFSYSPVETLGCPVTRAKNGWVNSFSEAEIIECFGAYRYRVKIYGKWNEQVIFTASADDSLNQR